MIRGVKHSIEGLFFHYSTIIAILLFFISCKHPVDGNENIHVADAGEDQVTCVGSYVIFDVSKTKLLEGETISSIEWIQAQENPEEAFIPTQSTLHEISPVGYYKEGIYKYTLSIKCQSGNLYTDEKMVTVGPRQKSAIEDTSLEINIRYKLDFKEGELSANKLLLLDTLSAAEMALRRKITSLKGIEYCTNLTHLWAGLQSITDLTPLSNLINLEYLDLDQNYTIEDISPLYNLTNLKTLILYSNPIKDIGGLGNLTKLTELWLLGTPISDISSLSRLVNLETLYFDGVGTGVNFDTIDPLKYLTKLKYLDISGRGLTGIKPLENLTELILLEISYNNLTEISAVSNMKKLVRLYLRRNNIIDISGIKNLENLDYLDAADNQIKDIAELQYLPNIHLIGISDNKIEDILPLVNNPNLGKGVYLFLDGDPLNEKSNNEYIPALIARGVQVYL